MPFNANDYNSPPWVAGVMTLTHEEVLEVKTACQEIIEAFVADQNTTSPDTQYVVSNYNKRDWNKAINGDTYNVVMAYDPEYNTQGIDANGIVPESDPVEETTPTEEQTEEEG